MYNKRGFSVVEGALDIWREDKNERAIGVRRRSADILPLFICWSHTTLGLNIPVGVGQNLTNPPESLSSLMLSTVEAKQSHRHEQRADSRPNRADATIGKSSIQ